MNITQRNGRWTCRVWDKAAGRAITKTWPTRAAAKSWGTAMEYKLRSGEAAAVAPCTLAAAAESWLADARAGLITNRSGQPYKASVLRQYEGSLRLHVLPKLGRAKLADLRVDMLQRLAREMSAAGQAPQSVRNHINPLRVIFAEARRNRLMVHNPLDGLKLPSGETARDRITTPGEAVELLAALEHDRALWATAFYTGMRRGELAALDWAHVDLIERTIYVDPEYGAWDFVAREFIAPKSKAGGRTVPFPDLLLPFLAAENRTEGRVFGPDGTRPFAPKTVTARANARWGYASLRPVTLHECRHTYASLMLAAGVDMTKVSRWMGHSSITITVDRYGHLVPGSAREDMQRFQDYLTKETDA